MHLTALSHWSRSIGTGGRHASEPVDAITGMRTLEVCVRLPDGSVVTERRPIGAQTRVGSRNI